MVTFIKTVFSTFREVVQEDDTTSLAYYLILSFVPSLTLVFLVLSVFDFHGDYIFKVLELYLTKDALELVKSLLEGKNQITGINIPSIIIMWSSLWGSSKGMHTVRRVANVFYGTTRQDHNTIKDRIVSMGYMLLFIILIVCILFLFGVLPIYSISLQSKSWFRLLRIVLLFLIAFIVLIMLNYFVPSISLKLEEVMLGSLVSSFAFTVFIVVFTIILEMWDYRSVYGPLSLVVIALIGFNIISIIIYVGFCINAVLYETAREKKLEVVFDEEAREYKIRNRGVE